MTNEPELEKLANEIMLKIKDRVEIRLSMEPEDIPIEGNASALTPEEDEITYKWIRDQLKSGNDWAWCHVTVTATFGKFIGYDSLGGCSYESEKDFRQPGGYYDDMVSQATRECAKQIAQSILSLKKLELIP